MKPPIFDPAWSDEVKTIYAHDMQEIWDDRRAPHVWNQYHNQLDIYMSLVERLCSAEPKKILDVGCAQGTLAMLLAEAGHRVVAVDIRQHFLHYAQSRYTHGDVRFVCANAFDVELDEAFDIVFANQIIEHLVYPQRLLARLKSMIAPGGFVIVTTPNHSYFKNDLPSFSSLGDAAKYEDRQFSSDADGHFYAYTVEELTAELVSCGFHDVHHKIFETPIISGHFKVRYLHRFIPSRVLTMAERFVVNSSPMRKICHQLMVIGRV